jgi:hypothetical protein
MPEDGLSNTGQNDMARGTSRRAPEIPCPVVGLPQDGLAVLAGFGAGLINTMVGSGTLIIFPVLLLSGMSPIAANIATNIGLAPGSLSAAVGYWSAVPPPRRRVFMLCCAAAGGAIGGVALLLFLPSGVFTNAAVAMIGIAIVLAIFQVHLNRAFTSRHGAASGSSRQVWLSVFVTSVYGAYFGAGQSTILFSLMAIFMVESLQEVNALRNVLLAVDNTVAAVIYAFAMPVDWMTVLFIAVGAIIGGQVGARISRRASPAVLRAAVVVVGTIGIIELLRK